MSSFDGFIKELRHVAVDSFLPKNFKCTSFFLSHCHRDHMRGLKDSAFSSLLYQSPNTFLYCSEITHKILLNSGLYCVRDKIIALPANISSLIHVFSSDDSLEAEDISVSTIPAGHCPGSVMFLFEAASCTVLYTGDFRILKGDIKKFKALHSINGKAKTIDTLYLDTTFFSNSYQWFPSREKSLEIICEITSKWLKRGQQYHVNFTVPALYGSEYLFRIVANEFDTKVHVSDRVYSFYKCVPEIKDAVTNDPKLSRIHCYDTKELQKVLSGFINKSDDKEIHIKTIKPSALIFKNNIDETMKLFYSDSDIDRVCYSSHSSFSELKDIILHLKPSKIVPCVQPPYMTIEDVKLALRELGVCEVDLSSLSNSDVGEPFSIETKTDDKMIAICKNVCPEFSPLEELLDSPPRKRMA